MASATHDDQTWRQQIEKRYGTPLPDDTWRWLVGMHYIAELEEGGAATVDYVVDQVRGLNAAAPAAIARSTRKVATSRSTSLFDAINSRMQAVADVIAWRATKNSRVRNYRRRWLRGGLIGADEVTAWIDQTYHQHLPERWPSEPGPTQATNFPGRFALWPQPHVVLEWVDATASTSKVWCVPKRGPLAELARLAQNLANDWDWNPALATSFLLTGDTPARPGVRGVSFRRRSGSDGCYGSYDLMSVRCSIDIEMTPEELAGWWRGVRDALGISGRRPMGDKSVRLAMFAMSRDDSNATFREHMEEWNRQVPEDWRFTDYRNFRTAAFKAVAALNHPATGCRFPLGNP